MNSLQKIQLQMYKELRDLLNDNGIIYFAIGGTAIGAVREKGFIPWDDDIDISIKEEQYDLFKSIISKSKFELKTKKILDGKFDDEADLIYFLKVYDPDIWIDDNGCKTNLYIDVMIAQKERIYTKNKMMKFHMLNLIAHSKKYKFKDIKRWDGSFVAVGYSILRLIFLPMTTKNVKKSMDDLIFKTKKSPNNNKMYFTYHVAHNEFWNVNEIVEYKFEDSVMPVTRTFKEDIKHIFGDVMVRPPKEQRVNPHKIHLIKK